MSNSESDSSYSFTHKTSDPRLLYESLITGMIEINEVIGLIEVNLKNILKSAGPLENHVANLLHKLPRPKIKLPMETESNSE